MARKKKEELKDWTVTARCTVMRQFYCPQCTEDDARNKTIELAQDETDMEMTDYEVIAIKEDK